MKDMIQHVIIVFSDGTRATFSGKAVAFTGDTMTIQNIVFTEPQPLPEGCVFGTLKEGEIQ